MNCAVCLSASSSPWAAMSRNVAARALGGPRQLQRRLGIRNRQCGRQGYENSGYAQLTLLLLLARTRGVRRAGRVIHLEPLMSGNPGESARALHIVIERTCTSCLLSLLHAAA